MRKKLLHFSIILALFCLTSSVTKAETVNPPAVTALLARVTNAANKFVTILDDKLATPTKKEVFVITAKDGKSCIKGSSISAITMGINWYLNHYAHINLSWNRLTADLSSTELPVPVTAEQHEASVDYRYYLNYCTFSYSMATWTWARWQKEIDWMALHGINMPLQIVGLDVVWHKLLTKDLGYSEADAGRFIAGPAFQAWWGMNNLQGWGGPNPAWWYVRQEKLCRQILARERELGMEPVLPGYSGMVPSDIGKKGYSANAQGNWCGFVRPYILDPNSSAFAAISAKYYARLKDIMGTSRYYSMDPFHEGANTSGIDVPSAYSKIAQAMTTANPDGHWVIQFWQWSGAQYDVLDEVAKGKLIILDLFSDAHTHFGAYKGHDAIYCMLPNFGGRTGLFGRLTKIMTDFFAQKAVHSNIKGIGATPEAIEQVPILYDALFELAWRKQAPDVALWVKNYATARYGTDNANAAAAWEKLRTSSLDCPTALQGPMEAVVCARPALNVGSVSTWGGTEIFYNPQEVVRAAALLNTSGLSGENYSYDAVDLNRQALTDYAYYLLQSINRAHVNKSAAYKKRRDLYLGLILDLDRLLSTNSSFMLGHWTQMARAIADEVTGTTVADRNWLEMNNARTLISTWGARDQAEGGGLRDYSYREWAGMLKDYYYPRWAKFFEYLDNGTSHPDWFDMDWDWAHNTALCYLDRPIGTTQNVAAELFAKYFLKYQAPDGTPYYIYRGMDQDFTSIIKASAYRGETFSLTGFSLPKDAKARIFIDLNDDGNFSDNECGKMTFAVPATATTGEVKAKLVLTDGTEVNFFVTLRERITTSREVSVGVADKKQGTATINGLKDAKVNTKDAVVLCATPATGYDFYNWGDRNGNVISTANPYTYYGKDAAHFTAYFTVNKWGAPRENLRGMSDVRSYSQYVASMKVTQNGNETREIYSATDCPLTLFHTTQFVNAARGSRLKVTWNDPGTGGLGYCRLSAYIDLNGDGDFEDAGEFIAVVGDKNTGGNTQLSNGSLNILLPYDMPLGITHIRFRFDSSYIGGWDNKTGARPAKAETERMIYDIPLNVTAYAPMACKIGVASANVKQGTADANGQPDTYVYSAGEDVVLRAYPTDGYCVSHWTDSYGRNIPAAWYDGNFLRFKAPESNTYTVHFKMTKALTRGD